MIVNRIHTIRSSRRLIEFLRMPIFFFEDLLKLERLSFTRPYEITSEDRRGLWPVLHPQVLQHFNSRLLYCIFQIKRPLDVHQRSICDIKITPVWEGFFNRQLSSSGMKFICSTDIALRLDRTLNDSTSKESKMFGGIPIVWLHSDSSGREERPRASIFKASIQSL